MYFYQNNSKAWTNLHQTRFVDLFTSQADYVHYLQKHKRKDRIEWRLNTHISKQCLCPVNGSSVVCLN